MFVNERVSKVVAESPRGSFCLLPRHIDFLTALVPGILSYITMDGNEVFLAVEKGILVKNGDHVLVSTRHAVKGDLGELKQQVDTMMGKMREHEQAVRFSFARLEADFVRRFMEFGKIG
jgi:F-type H+-transporting ATPase subunit epsilon